MNCPRCKSELMVFQVSNVTACSSCGFIGKIGKPLDLTRGESVRREHRPPHVRNYASGGYASHATNRDSVYAFVAMLMDPPEMTMLTLRVAAPNTDAITLAYFLDKSARMWPIAADMVSGELQRVQQEAR